MRLLLGITGLMGSGKSTVASYLTSNYNFQSMRISGKMHEIAQELGIKATRDYLQGISQFMKTFDEDVWIKYIVKKVKQTSSSIVIDDIRRQNEIDFLQPIGFKFLKVETTSFGRKERIELREAKKISEKEWERWSKHSTEVQVPKLPADYVIKNDESLQYFEQQIDRILKELGFRKS
jgi:dephospho-CoA kinase